MDVDAEMSLREAAKEMSEKSMLDCALEYYDKGFCVIPAKYGTKEALVEWKQYQTERPSREQVKEWFSGEKRNIALVCGQVSGGLTVLDFDDLSVYPKFFDTQKIEASTPVVETPRPGIQVHVISDKPVKTFKIPELNMEVRSEGAIVIAPPSLHPSGKQYRFINTVETPLIVKDLEESVWNTVEKIGVRKKVFVDPTWRTGKPGYYKGPDPPCISELLKGTVKGSRHDSAIRLFSYFINFRREKPKRVYEKLKKWNEKNAPPLEEEELTDIYQDVAKGPYNYGCTDCVFRLYCDHLNCEIGKNKLPAEAIEKAQELMSDPIAFIKHLQQCLEYKLTNEWKNRIFLFLVACGAQIRTVLSE